MIWVCTHCKEVGAEPEVKLLDGSYGSGRCYSPTCKRAKRLFHKEVNRDDAQQPK